MPTFANGTPLVQVRSLLNETGLRKNDFAATEDPTPDYDERFGWEVGSRIMSGGVEWVCKDATASAAVWVPASDESAVVIATEAKATADGAVIDAETAQITATAADAKATEAQAAAQAATQMDLCLTTNFLAGLGSWTNSFPTRATMSLVGSDMVLTKIGASVAFFEDAPVLRGGFGGRNMQMTVDVTRTSSVTSTMVVWIGVVTGPTADGVGATETGTIFRISAPLGVRVKRTVNLSVPLDRPYGRVRIKLVSGQTGDVLTVHSVSVQDSRVSAPYIDVKRGRVDMSALIESPSDPADRVTAGEANGALIEAGLSESISTGRTVVIPRGSYPTDQIIMPGAGGWSLEMEDGAVLRPASANYGGFFRQSNYGTEGAFMRNVKIYGLHIDPFTEIVDGVETPFAGNGFVGRIEDSPELYDFRFVYSRDQAMLIALVNSQLDGLYFYTEDTGGGTGGLRWNCGFESVIRSVRGQSGDDALMMYGDGLYNGASPHASEYVGQTLGMTRCGIVDAAVGCARARMLIIATTGVTAGDIDSLEEGGDVIDCFARGISSVGKDFLSTVVVTSSNERVVRGLDLQVQTKTEYSIAEYGPKSDWRRPPCVLTLNGHIKGVTADLRVETPEAAYAAIINDVARSGGGTYAPDNVRLRLSGVMGDFVANTYGANYVETGGYSDTKSGLVRIHAATNCVVDLSGIDGGDNRHGVVATQTRNLKVIGNAALNTSVDATSRYVVYAPDAVADVDDNVMHGVGRFVSSWLPDPTTPQNVNLSVDCAISGTYLTTSLGHLTASTARITFLDNYTIGAGTMPKRGWKSASMPTTGAWVAGSIVDAIDPIVSGPDLIVGWFRLTTGSAHVLGTDWRAILG